MSRRAIAALFVLLLGASACKDDTARVQPDRTTTTASPAQSGAATGSAQANAADGAPVPAAATGDAMAYPTAAVSALAAQAQDDADADDDDDSADERVSADDFDGDDDDDDGDAADGDEPAPKDKVAQTDTKPKPAPTVEADGPFVKRDSVAQTAPGGAVKAKGPAPAKPTAKKPAKPAPKPMATSELKLVKAGSAPRKKLRLQVKKGQVETMKMVLTMDMSVKELKQKQSLPPMAMTMRLKVAETRPNGDIKYNFTLTKTDVKGGKGHDPRLVAGMKQAMQKIYGLSGHAVVSDRGMNREAKINLPPTVDAQTKQVMQGMEQAMQQIGAPLPVEEVGKGARWTYTTKLSQAGVSLVQVATYDLVKLDGNKVTLKARVKQSAPKQQIAAPTGAQVSLLNLASKGKGKTRMVLTQLAPSKSSMKLKSTMTMGAGNGKTMSIVTGMLIDISSR